MLIKESKYGIENLAILHSIYSYVKRTFVNVIHPNVIRTSSATQVHIQFSVTQEQET